MRSRLLQALQPRRHLRNKLCLLQAGSVAGSSCLELLAMHMALDQPTETATLHRCTQRLHLVKLLLQQYQCSQFLRVHVETSRSKDAVHQAD